MAKFNEGDRVRCIRENSECSHYSTLLGAKRIYLLPHLIHKCCNKYIGKVGIYRRSYKSGITVDFDFIIKEAIFLPCNSVSFDPDLVTSPYNICFPSHIPNSISERTGGCSIFREEDFELENKKKEHITNKKEDEKMLTAILAILLRGKTADLLAAVKQMDAEEKAKNDKKR